jgi:hypothetical protein
VTITAVGLLVTGLGDDVQKQEVSMAVCQYCNQEMMTAEGCVPEPIVISGESYEPVRYGSEPGLRGLRKRCHDCKVLPGQVHHHGCDVERCPACRLQSISCDYLWAGEEDPDEDWEDEMEELQLVGPDD